MEQRNTPAPPSRIEQLDYERQESMAKPRGKSDIFGGSKKTDYNYMAYLEDEIRKKEREERDKHLETLAQASGDGDRNKILKMIKYCEQARWRFAKIRKTLNRAKGGGTYQSRCTRGRGRRKYRWMAIHHQQQRVAREIGRTELCTSKSGNAHPLWSGARTHTVSRTRPT